MENLEGESGVYLLHLDPPVSHMGHYLGYSRNLARRLREHQGSNPAQLVKTALRRGSTVSVGKVWIGETQGFEQRLKKQGGFRRYCDLCQNFPVKVSNSLITRRERARIINRRKDELKMSEDGQTKSGWGTQAGSGRIIEYNPDKYYFRSTNQHNHATSVTVGQGLKEQLGFERVKLPPELLARMAELVADSRFPYKNHQDLIRDALHHRVCQVAERDKDDAFMESFSMVLLKQEIAQQIFEDNELASTIEYLTSEAEVYVKDHNPDGVADIIGHARDYVVPPRLRRQWREAMLLWRNMEERAG